MNTLFPLEQILPDGFPYLEDFITESEENTCAKKLLHSTFTRSISKASMQNERWRVLATIGASTNSSYQGGKIYLKHFFP